MAHIGLSRLIETSKLSNQLEDIVTYPKCHDCLTSKTDRPDFRENVNKATRPLERVHADLSGKLRPTINDERYYLAITDEATNATDTLRRTDVVERFAGIGLEHDRSG